MKLEVKKIGNSTGLILPKELLNQLNLSQGDWVYVSRTADGGLKIGALRSGTRKGHEYRAGGDEGVSRYLQSSCEMTEPKWLTVAEVEDIHEEQLALFGGPSGIRDRGLLELALDRAKNRWAYEKSDLPELAAAYACAFGLARNHPFIDGNKPAAFASLMVFLRYNGVPFAAPTAEATAIFLDLAAGVVDEAQLAHWIRDNWPGGRGIEQRP